MALSFRGVTVDRRDFLKLVKVVVLADVDLSELFFYIRDSSIMLGIY